MKKQKLTEEEKFEKDFKQFSLLTLKMIAQSDKNPKQLRRLKSMYNFLGSEIKQSEKDSKPKSDPFDPYKRKYYASKGFYQQLTAAGMMGLKSEASLVKYRKNGVLKENIHWIRTVGRGISYKPELCKLAIRKEKLGY
jgi:hypothetical protein|tara:strand:- start:87 stop:500 length:414 start_codon:yes stop_codon:yes gene_type:complete